MAAFHIMRTPAGSFAEYALAPQHLVFPIPENISFEEAATIPLAAYTSALALFYELEFPSPWDKAAQSAAKAGTKRPLIVYGASSAIGAFAIKLAKQASIHPIIAIGSKNSKFIMSSLEPDKGDTLIDYMTHKSDEDLVAAIKKAVVNTGVEGGRVFDAFDCVSDERTLSLLGKVLAGAADSYGRKPRVTVVLPGLESGDIDPSVDITTTMVSLPNETAGNKALFGLIWGQAFFWGLVEGWLAPHPYEVAKGGLYGLEDALKGLREGKVRAKKVLVRPGETEGAGA